MQPGVIQIADLDIVQNVDETRYRGEGREYECAAEQPQSHPVPELVSGRILRWLKMTLLKLLPSSSSSCWPNGLPATVPTVTHAALAAALLLAFGFAGEPPWQKKRRTSASTLAGFAAGLTTASRSAPLSTRSITYEAIFCAIPFRPRGSPLISRLMSWVRSTKRGLLFKVLQKK